MLATAVRSPGWLAFRSGPVCVPLLQCTRVNRGNRACAACSLRNGNEKRVRQGVVNACPVLKLASTSQRYSYRRPVHREDQAATLTRRRRSRQKGGIRQGGHMLESFSKAPSAPRRSPDVTPSGHSHMRDVGSRRRQSGHRSLANRLIDGRMTGRRDDGDIAMLATRRRGQF